MKNISFVPSSLEVERNIPHPKPAKQYIPKWYKGFGSFYNLENNSYTNELLINKTDARPFTTVKACMPFLDTLTTGYIQETWCDVNIQNDGINISYSYAYGNSQELEIIGHRSISTIPYELIPYGYHNKVMFHWGRYWNPILPKGYSALITHPFNREDLPFKTLSGIIDSDEYFIEGKAGFFIKEGFSGIIPKGTPMYQIIPFKRESWKSNIINRIDIEEKAKSQAYKVVSVFTGGYKKIYWKRKDFN